MSYAQHAPRGTARPSPARGDLSCTPWQTGAMARSVEALVDEIDVVASRGLPRKEFFAEIAPRVRTVVDNDASCWHTLDPYTRLLTSDDPAELIGRGILTPEQGPGAGELIIRSEYMIDDVNTFDSNKIAAIARAYKFN